MDELDPEFDPDRGGVVAKWLVFLFLLGLVAVIFAIVFFGRELTLEERGGSEKRPVPRDFELLLASGTPEQLKSYSIGLTADAREQDRAQLLASLRKRIAIADRIEAISSDPEMRAFAYLSRIDSTWVLNELRMITNLPREEVAAELLALGEQGRESANPEVRRKANLGLVIYHVTEFVDNPAHFEACRDQLAESGPLLAKSEDSAQGLAAVVAFIRKSRDLERREQLLRQMAKILLSSPLQTNREQGARILDILFDDHYRFELLFRQLAIGEEGAAATVRDLVADAAGTQGLPFSTWITISLAVEALHGAGRRAEIPGLVAQLETAAAQIEEPEMRRKVLRLLEKQRERAALWGQPIELAGTDLNGKPFATDDFRGRWTVLLFSAEGAPRCQEAERLLDEMVTVNANPVHRLVVRFRPANSATDPDPPKGGRFESTMQVADGDAVSDSLKSFPVGSMPYLVLIDPEGRIADLNVVPDQLRRRLGEALETKPNLR